MSGGAISGSGGTADTGPRVASPVIQPKIIRTGQRQPRSGRPPKAVLHWPVLRPGWCRDHGARVRRVRASSHLRPSIRRVQRSVSTVLAVDVTITQGVAGAPGPSSRMPVRGEDAHGGFGPCLTRTPFLATPPTARHLRSRLSSEPVADAPVGVADPGLVGVLVPVVVHLGFSPCCGCPNVLLLAHARADTAQCGPADPRDRPDPRTTSVRISDQPSSW